LCTSSSWRLALCLLPSFLADPTNSNFEAEKDFLNFVIKIGRNLINLQKQLSPKPPPFTSDGL
jgi:hypothetical protein